MVSEALMRQLNAQRQSPDGDMPGGSVQTRSHEFMERNMIMCYCLIVSNNLVGQNIFLF